MAIAPQELFYGSTPVMMGLEKRNMGYNDSQHLVQIITHNSTQGQATNEKRADQNRNSYEDTLQ